MNKNIKLLLLGDILSVIIISITGFLWHGENKILLSYRMLAMILPTLVGWILVAPWLGLYKAEIYTNWKQLWRAGWAIILAAPLATFFRSLMLGLLPIIPIFVAVLAATGALGMLIWRGVWWFILQKRK
ncbi:MAG: DUF3054 domain-containing protein [Chloroflexi bacterium]|nr:DUF3054 domain-containing protein [Chloroflexota bacterium]